MSALLFHMIGGAPDPVAPFSHAVEADGWVFVTGQMPYTATSNTSPYPDTIEEQTRQVMQNLTTVLRDAVSVSMPSCRYAYSSATSTTTTHE